MYVWHTHTYIYICVKRDTFIQLLMMGMAEWYNKILLDMYTNPYTLVYCLCSAQSKLIATLSKQNQRLNEPERRWTEVVVDDDVEKRRLPWVDDLLIFCGRLKPEILRQNHRVSVKVCSFFLDFQGANYSPDVFATFCSPRPCQNIPCSRLFGDMVTPLIWHL